MMRIVLAGIQTALMFLSNYLIPQAFYSNSGINRAVIPKAFSVSVSSFLLGLSVCSNEVRILRKVAKSRHAHVCLFTGLK